MYESIIGSLIATVISKTTGRIYKKFSEWSAIEMEKDKRDKLEQEMQTLRKEFVPIMQNLSALLEKIFILGRIRSFVEWAEGKFSKADDVTVKDVDEVDLLYSRLGIEEDIKTLASPLKLSKGGTKVKDLLRRVNELTLNIETNLQSFKKNKIPDMITACLKDCIDLEKKLQKLAETNTGNA